MDKTEAVARAIDPGAWMAWIYDDVSPSKEERQNTARKNAWSAISAAAKHDADNGLVTVPREPTEAMRKVVAAHEEIIGAMRESITMETVRAENLRFRKALEEIAQSGPVDQDGNHDPEAGWSWCYDRAQRALGCGGE